MKTLELNQMENVNGGHVIDWACAGVGIASFFFPIARLAKIGCAAWALGRAS